MREGKVNIFTAFGQNTTENEWRGVWRRYVSSCFRIFRARCCAKFEKKKPFCLQTKLVGSCLTLARIQCVQDMPAKTVQR